MKEELDDKAFITARNIVTCAYALETPGYPGLFLYTALHSKQFE
ncbi:hypothetical protein P4H66_25200 [Paenibacillus dokdonensis]|uniref:Uncharacterized protein n=1 Tax=Paenibacillus dokdonensis TaxID=2567944 RepID=A0ABU6GV57_9BACL|nr:hypothetical protein [Paenibacillus dokdonensis]MEC0243113.1 hypothetical protein [Paenibacillus dokdonensis]